jgi:hypothetical protein
MALAIIAVLLMSPGVVRADDAAADAPPVAPSDADALKQAVHAAIGNGVATLLARQTAPGNPTDWVFPPVPRERREVEVRMSWKEVDVPVFESKTERRLVAVHDEYGNLKGFEMRNVQTGRTVVGTRKERKLVPDPSGDVVRIQRRLVIGEGSQAKVDYGLIALNSMALYVYSQAGVPRGRHRDGLASEIVRLIEQVGLPDMTADLAWLAVGLIAHGDPAHRDLIQRTLGKLIDGQIRDRGPAAGMWGPICIHYPTLARGMDTSVQIVQELSQTRSQIEKAQQPSRADLARLRQLEDLSSEFTRLMRYVTVQGDRLQRSIGDYVVNDMWLIPGLPYQIYSHVVVDLDSTAVAAFALDQAQAAGVMPRQTHRDPFRGRPLSPPEASPAALTAGLRAVVQLQQPHGGWHASNLIVPNATFAGSKAAWGDIRINNQWPTLTSPESMRSNMAGAAALVHLARASGPQNPLARNAWSKAQPRLDEVLQAWLVTPAKSVAGRRVYEGVTDRYDDLVKSSGALPPDSDAPASVSDLPIGYFVAPYDVLPGVLAMMRQPERGAADPDAAARVYAAAARRLVLLQHATGQWLDDGRGPFISSGEMAEQLRDAAQRLVRRGHRPDREPQNLIRIQTLTGHIRGQSMAPKGLYATLQSLVVLLEVAPDSIDLESLVILPDPDTLGDDVDFDSLMPDDAVTSVIRPNPHLESLAKPGLTP